LVIFVVGEARFYLNGQEIEMRKQIKPLSEMPATARLYVTDQPTVALEKSYFISFFS
jgi:hypothetical protein